MAVGGFLRAVGGFVGREIEKTPRKIERPNNTSMMPDGDEKDSDVPRLSKDADSCVHALCMYASQEGLKGTLWLEKIVA